MQNEGGVKYTAFFYDKLRIRFSHDALSEPIIAAGEGGDVAARECIVARLDPALR